MKTLKILSLKFRGSGELLQVPKHQRARQTCILCAARGGRGGSRDGQAPPPRGRACGRDPCPSTPHTHADALRANIKRVPSAGAGACAG